MAKGTAGELSDAVAVEFPLRGEWFAVHSPGSHIPSHGTDQLAQRYAFDLQRLDDHRRLHAASSLRTWVVGVPMHECYGYGEPVHAALGGEVVAASDGATERRWLHPVRELFHVIATALTFRPTERNIRRVVGNHVIVKSEVGFAVYAHLAPGSVAVTEGRRSGQETCWAWWAAQETRQLRICTSSSWTSWMRTLRRRSRACFASYERRRDDGWELVHKSVPRTTDRIRSVDLNDRPPLPSPC